MNKSKQKYLFWKRFFDISGSLVLLILASPAMLIISIIVWRDLGKPLIFSQQRPGKNGRVFLLRKFRTMKSFDLRGGMIMDSERLTKVGRVLRSTSLDELPSLWNVLVGDMSFIGPRPLLVSYLELYSDEEARRHNVKPGITGLAQVSGRNTLNWSEKFKLDIYYVDHLSFKLDTTILLRTLSTVLKRHGISHEGDATMPEFRGTKS